MKKLDHPQSCSIQRPADPAAADNLFPSNLQYSSDGASLSLLWYQRPKDSDWSSKKVFIFVPDFKEAYIATKTIIIIVLAAFSYDCSGLCLHVVFLGSKTDEVRLKSHKISRGYIQRLLKGTAGSCLSLLVLCTCPPSMPFLIQSG